MLHVVQQVSWYFRARYFQAAATPENGPLTQREFTDVSGVDRVKEAWRVCCWDQTSMRKEIADYRLAHPNDPSKIPKSTNPFRTDGSQHDDICVG